MIQKTFEKRLRVSGWNLNISESCKNLTSENERFDKNEEKQVYLRSIYSKSAVIQFSKCVHQSFKIR